MADMKVECGTCVHRVVCCFKKEFEHVQEYVDGVSISFPKEDGQMRMKRLKDISFIEPIRLRCIHYVADRTLQPTIKNDWRWSDITGTTTATLASNYDGTEVIDR